MAQKKERNTRTKIVNAAWKLFYEQGYENTTVEEIVECSRTSKGSFYHYFTGKDALLGTLSTLFDDKYKELEEQFSEGMTAMDKLLFLNGELFGMIENSISIELLSGLLASQLTAAGERSLLDHRRMYYRLLRKIIVEGQEKGELNRDLTAGEMVKLYALSERALMYDWCLCGGEYSLKQYGLRTMPSFLSAFVKKTF
ncbi:MAG: TetR/AcrR family transcriptional regulator [Lachnospiraceae bacterium]|nr:TetR/AcrR family transcriptional regulator [Lachnospiraceae bacterium]